MGLAHPLIGGGGITAIVLARLGTPKPHAALNQTVRLKELNDNLGDISRTIKSYCDLMDVTRALHRLHRDDK